MKYIRQLSIILSISFLAELLEYFIPLPIAASIYGLVFLLIGLMTKIIQLDQVEDTANFFVDNISILFIPATVGIITSADSLKEMLIPLCVISVLSTFLVMAVTGRVTQKMLRKKKEKKSPQS